MVSFEKHPKMIVMHDLLLNLPIDQYEENDIAIWVLLYQNP